MKRTACLRPAALLGLLICSGLLSPAGEATSPQHAAAPALPAGPQQIEIHCGTNLITVFTYKPDTYRDGPLIVVFHGRARNAQEYRDFAIPLAQRLNAIVAAPWFDPERFPIHDYTLGGVLQNGVEQPREKWFFSNIETLVTALRQREGKTDLDYYLLGHSAGGQMLMRLAAFQPMTAKRIVAANPGSDLFPRRDWDYGYGFGQLSGALGDDAALQRYLAAPLTLYLGTADILTDQENLDRSEGAQREGKHRLERGRACFAFAAALAQDRGWQFNWRKVETPGIAHDAKGMFTATEVEAALLGETK